MDYDQTVSWVQGHFTDGLTLIVGSGLSAAEGMPGMPALATHLSAASHSLSEVEMQRWVQVRGVLDQGQGLEAALLLHPPTQPLEEWIVRETCALLRPAERAIMGSVLAGTRELRLTSLLRRMLKPTVGLPIVTPNYDRLVELACEMAGYHVDTTAIGQYAGEFDHERSCMSSARGISSRGRRTFIEHFPRAVVLKPHGSLDWFQTAMGPRRCSADVDADCLIVTPGLNKYRAGYDAPFDKQRDIANDLIRRANRFVVVGYGFNDDHLETHLVKRIQDGTPTLVLSRSIGAKVQSLAIGSPHCVAFSERSEGNGVAILAGSSSLDRPGSNLWDLGILVKEVLS
jgi:SIR2-like domain